MLNAAKIINLAGVGKIPMIGYTPDGATGPLPTVVFFPGAGESITWAGVSDPNKLFVHGPLNFVKSGWTPAFNIYAFQSPDPGGTDWGHDPIFVRECLAELVNGNYGVDKTKIYLTGLSNGCSRIMNYLQFCPDASYIAPAAVIPMSMNMYGLNGVGATAILGGNDMRFLKTPMWFFCGTNDDFYQNESNYYSMRKKAGNITDRFSTRPIGHGPWNPWYDPKYKDPVFGGNIYEDWALQYSTVVAPPVIIPPVIIPPTPAKTIKNIIINYSDGSSITLP